MSRILHSRFFRCLVCFVLICCILVASSPFRVQATSAGLAGVISGAASVSVSAPMVIGATLIALGLSAGINGTAGLEAVVDSAVSHLESAGEFIKDGAVELIRTVDEAGTAAYYVAGEMMESLRSWVFDSSIVSETISTTSCSVSCDGSSYTISSDQPFQTVCIWWTGYAYYAGYAVVAYAPIDSSFSGVTRSDTGRFCGATKIGNYKVAHVGGSSGTSWNDKCPSTNLRILSDNTGLTTWQYAFASIFEANVSFIYTSHDLTLGYLPSQTSDLTDGTSARAWSEAMTNNGLKVIEGGGSDPEPPDENNGKWFWPLALTLTAGELYLLSQADEWSGKTPQEFDDYSTKTEYEIVSRPEVEFGYSIEIAPVTSPSPDTGGGDPGTDPDQDGTEEIKTDYTTWFSKLYTSVENIAGKFDEIPNKFQSWISDLKTDIQTQTDKLAEHASNTLTSIQSIPEAFSDKFSEVVNAIKALPSSIADAFAQKEPAQDMQNYTLDLKDYFPFCIPFDLYDFFTCLNADPVAPVIEWVIPLPGGETYPLELDLAVFDDVAQLLRRLQLLLFCVGLAFKTRDLIRG